MLAGNNVFSVLGAEYVRQIDTIHDTVNVIKGSPGHAGSEGRRLKEQNMFHVFHQTLF